MSFLVDFLVWGTRLSKITHRGEPLEWHMDDLVNRLRDKEMSFSECWLVMLEAANRIEALERQQRAAERNLESFDKQLTDNAWKYQERIEDQAMMIGARIEILEHNNKKLHRYEDALREIANHWTPSVNEWATKFKGIANRALDEK